MTRSEEKAAFERDGYVLVENLLTAEETAILQQHADKGRDVRVMPDADGRASKLDLWMDVRGDVFGAVARQARIVERVRALLGEDVYHWHSKVMMKEPRVGGAWEWHQDYGYWYTDGCLYPRMLSCMVALDPATKANGCLQVIPGSHLLGRLEHGKSGGQSAIDPQRIEAVLERLPRVYAEMPAGSALFFHGNTLHSSGPNTSDVPRRAFICCYNAWSNRPYGGKGHGKPQVLELAAPEAILAFAAAAK